MSNTPASFPQSSASRLIVFQRFYLMIPAFVAGLGVGIACAFFFFFAQIRAVSSLFVAAPSASSTPMVETAFAAAWNWRVKEGTRVLILPHHLVAAREIASLVRETPAPSVVYLVSPDHFSRGTTVFTTTDKAVIGREHGVTNLLPFFATAWPGTRVVPILVRKDAGEKDRQALANELIAHLTEDPRALLVTSIDFSHYLPAEIADFHDILAQDVMMSLADFEVDRVESDHAGGLAIALAVARALGLGDVTIHSHTNSLRLLKAEIAQESTSHFLASFSPGEIVRQKKITLLLLGDLMFDRTVRERMRAAHTLEYPFAKIRGSEDRLLWGQDLVVANLEGPVTAKRRAPDKEIDFAFDPAIVPILKKMRIDAVSQANNHAFDQGREGARESRAILAKGGIVPFGDQLIDSTSTSLAILERRGQRVALVGFNTTDHALDRNRAAEILREAKRQARHVLVFLHWGEEYRAKPGAAQVALAHWLIDQGAEAVIGAHPHWMQSIEVYRGRPIAYSLGNFIFDQDWSLETQRGLMLGLALGEEESEVHLFPIKIVKSQPAILTGKERRERLLRLAEISNPLLHKQILSGVIHTSFEW